MRQRPHPVWNHRPWRQRRLARKPPLWLAALALGAAAGMLAGAAGDGGARAVAAPVAALELASARAGRSFACAGLEVTDGDTMRCGNLRVRLFGIDAPELPGHCRQGRACIPGDPYASMANLRRLAGSGPIVCEPIETDHYGRIVARCRSAAGDLSCRQLAQGHAVPRYRALRC